MNEGAIITREADVLRWTLEREIIPPIENPQDFYRHAHVVIWAAVLHLKGQGRSVDYLSVRGELDRRGQLEAVGTVYLSELSRDSVRPSEAAIVSAAGEIKAEARNRRIRAMLAQHVAADRIDLSQVASDHCDVSGRP